jgi:molecular chaperone DnaJ
MRLSHEGEAGYYGGSPGDLYVHFEIKPHKFFVRRQDDIIMALPLNFAQAALGCSLEIPTMEGKFNLKVPAGTQHGRIFRIRDKGFPRINARGRGDQMVVVRLLTPEKLDAQQKKLLEDLMSSLPKTEDYARPDEELLNRVNQE